MLPKSLFAVVVFLIASNSAIAQRMFDVGVAFAKSQTSIAILGAHNWSFGKRDRLFAGVGARVTLYRGRNQYYATAPATITSGQRGPQVFFIPNITENMDSLLVVHPTVFLMNACVNLGYRFNDRLSIGFNIDAIGFSAGSGRSATYINGIETQPVDAKVSHFNALLVSDNDIGSLNSELFVKYRMNDRWKIKGGLQFLFTEYTTAFNIQQSPEPNDRFRRKSLLAMIGVSF